jgi:hypothetical protein
MPRGDVVAQSQNPAAQFTIMAKHDPCPQITPGDGDIILGMQTQGDLSQGEDICGRIRRQVDIRHR